MRFVHRKNSEGSFDSICMTCFRTAAHVAKEKMLATAELKHRCDPDGAFSTLRASSRHPQR
jgi:hypothetical protein